RARRRRVEHLDLVVRARVREVHARRPALVLERETAAGERDRPHSLRLRGGAKRRERVPLRVRPDGEVVGAAAPDADAPWEIADVDAAVLRPTELVDEPRLRADP